MNIPLTRSQREALRDYHTRASMDKTLGRPGMVLAQVRKDHMEVYYVDHDTAKRLIAAKNERVSNEIRENSTFRRAEQNVWDRSAAEGQTAQD